MKKLVPKKTRKVIHKSLRKIIKKHGPELVAAVAAGALGNTVADAVTDDDKKKSRKRRHSAKTAGKKKASGKSKQAQEAQLEAEP